MISSRTGHTLGLMPYYNPGGNGNSSKDRPLPRSTRHSLDLLLGESRSTQGEHAVFPEHLSVCTGYASTSRGAPPPRHLSLFTSPRLYVLMQATLVLIHRLLQLSSNYRANPSAQPTTELITTSDT